MSAWLGLIGVIAGVIVSWSLNLATKIISDRRKAIHDLKASAFVCLDRLLKIQNAKDRQQMDNEIYLLGGDLDRYRDCIANSPKMRKDHWTIYRKMMNVLLKHDLSELEEIITDLENISGARD